MIMDNQKFGKCIESGHDFVFCGAKDITRRGCCPDGPMYDYAWAVIRWRCARCGYIDERMAKGKEVRALKTLKIRSGIEIDAREGIHPPAAEDCIDGVPSRDAENQEACQCGPRKRSSFFQGRPLWPAVRPPREDSSQTSKNPLPDIPSVPPMPPVKPPREDVGKEDFHTPDEIEAIKKNNRELQKQIGTETRPQRVYAACPYTHEDATVRRIRFLEVSRYAAHLMANGVYVYSPISHTHPIAEAGDLPKGWEFWEPYDRTFLEWCDVVHVLMLDGWRESTGVNAEIRIAGEMRKPVRLIDPKTHKVCGTAKYAFGAVEYELIDPDDCPPKKSRDQDENEIESAKDIVGIIMAQHLDMKSCDCWICENGRRLKLGVFGQYMDHRLKNHYEGVHTDRKETGDASV